MSYDNDVDDVGDVKNGDMTRLMMMAVITMLLMLLIKMLLMMEWHDACLEVVAEST